MQVALAKQKMQSIQAVYDHMYQLYAEGKETDTEVADMLGIPDRVYLISQLSLELDKRIDRGELKRFKMPNESTPHQHTEGHLTAVVGETGVLPSSPPPPVDSAATTASPSKPKPKTWSQIRAAAEKNKKASSACAIL